MAKKKVVKRPMLNKDLPTPGNRKGGRESTTPRRKITILSHEGLTSGRKIIE